MPTESLGTSDGLGVAVNGHPISFLSHATESLLHAARHLTKPHELVGSSWEEDLDLFGRGIISAASLHLGHTAHRNPVVLEVRDAAGALKQRIYEHNCRTNSGGTWQSIAMGGDTNANIGYVASGSQTYTATGVTPTTSPAWAVNQWVDHIVSPYAGVYGVVVSNTATALVVDQWTTVGSATGAAGTTPAANTLFNILPGAAPAFWIALSTDTVAEDISNTTLAGEVTTGFTVAGRWKGAYTQTTVPSGTGTTNASSVITLGTGTLTANAAQTIAKVGLFTTQNGGNLKFVRKLTTAATLASGDTLSVTWTETAS